MFKKNKKALEVEDVSRSPDLETSVFQPMDLPKVKEEQILVCEKCGDELGYVLFFVRQEDICPTCHNQSHPNSCWLLCKKCRGYSN